MKKHTTIFLTAVLILTATVLSGYAKTRSAEISETEAGIANDMFAAAFALNLNGISVGQVSVNDGATKESGEPNHAENAGGKSVWFSFTPAATMNVRINAMEANFDTLLAVYTGSNVNNLTFVGSNDDCSSTCFGASTVDLVLSGGQTYYIAVDGKNTGAGAASGTFKIVVFRATGAFQDNLENAYNLDVDFTGGIAGTNHNAAAEPGEQNHSGLYPATKSVWYRWQTTTNHSADIELAENYRSVMSVWSSNVSSPTHAQLSRVMAEDDGTGFSQHKYRLTFFAESSKYYFISVDGQANVTPNDGNFQLKIVRHSFEYSFKFSDDDRATVSIFRPSNGTWYMRPTISQPFYKSFGTNGDTPVPADYNGDGMTDFAVTRNENGAKIWYISRNVVSQNYDAIQWGAAGDKAITGDFDRDGRADQTIVRQTATGLAWYVRQSSNGAARLYKWGANSDKPVLGDFDGDGATDIAVTRSEAGNLVWYILKSSFESGNAGIYNEFEFVYFGLGTDYVTAEDFDGDCKTDVAVFRPSSGTWYVRRSSDNQLQAQQFGAMGDVPQPADYNGDRKADFGVFRPSTATWFTSLNPATNYGAVQWGAANDILVASMSTLAE